MKETVPSEQAVPSDERPRVRAVDGSGEVGLSVYRHFADRDPLTRIVFERMLAGVSCRRYGRTGRRRDRQGSPRGQQVGDLTHLHPSAPARPRGELMARRLDDVRLAVLMLDGIDLKGRTNVVALRDHQ